MIDSRRTIAQRGVRLYKFCLVESYDIHETWSVYLHTGDILRRRQDKASSEITNTFTSALQTVMSQTDTHRPKLSSLVGKSGQTVLSYAIGGYDTSDLAFGRTQVACRCGVQDYERVALA